MKSNNIPYIVFGINLVFFLAFMVFQIPVNSDLLTLNSSSLDSPLNAISIINSNFMHAGLLHFAMNMYCIVTLKHYINDIYQKREQYYLYFITGIISSTFLALLLPLEIPAVGYSGIIFALVGAIFPFIEGEVKRFNVFGLFTFTVFKAKLIWGAFLLGWHLLIFIGIPLFWEGHLAGFIVGYLYAKKRFLWKDIYLPKVTNDDFDAMFSKDNSKRDSLKSKF